jgi:Abnormal spindle-like microcephaly-assoc'd, ASPM-SPD-2-Hydin/Cep192 domain 4
MRHCLAFMFILGVCSLPAKAQIVVSDNFARADGSLGPHWTTITNTPPVISSAGFTNGTGTSDNNSPTTTANAGVAAWNADSFGADQYASVTINAVGATGTDCAPGVVVRANSTSGGNWYAAWAGRNTTGTYPPYQVEVWKLVNGTSTVLSQVPAPPTVQVGDVLTLQVIGTTIIALWNKTIIFSGTDSSVSSGQPGIIVGLGTPGGDNPAATTTANDWIAGELTAGNAGSGATTLASDNFVRADANPLSGDWSTVTGVQPLEIVSDVVEPVSSNTNGYELNNSLSWPDNQWAQSTIVAASSNTVFTGVVLRSDAATMTGYACVAQGPSGSAGTISIERWISGAATILTRTSSFTLQNGDVIYLEIVGTTLRCEQNGTVLLTTEDAMIKSGSAGIFGQAGSSVYSQANGWSGGTFAPNLSPSSLTFTGQPVGTSSTAQTVTLNNTGNTGLVISNLVIGGANGSDFAETDNCDGSVSAGSSCNINVTFAPTASGTRAGTLAITDNLAGEPLLVSLAGTGITPTRILSLSPSSLTFTGQPVGTSSTAQTVTLSNTGNTGLVISNLVIGGANGSDFAETDNCDGSVSAGLSCNINMIFAPAATGTRAGTLTITDNAFGSPQTVMLLGVGQDFSVTPTSSQAPPVAPGQTASYSLTVAPIGGFNQSVAFTCTGAPSQSACTVSPNLVALNGLTATTISVSVPTAARSILVHELAPSSPASMPIYRLVISILGLWVLVLMGCLIGRSRDWHPRITYGIATLLLLSVGMAMSACGGGGSGAGGGNHGTPAGTYTLAVSATSTSGSATLTHNTNLTLIVQ